MITILDFNDVLKRHQKEAPVQTVPIANEIGIDVYKTLEWPNDLSGMIQKSEEYAGESGYAIFVNASHPETRRRFTIAHEISHFVLHRNLIGDGIKDDALYRSGLSSAVEAGANRLAADILMPWRLINSAIDKGIDRIDALAVHFNVSKSAMSIRLGVPYES